MSIAFNILDLKLFQIIYILILSYPPVWMDILHKLTNYVLKFCFWEKNHIYFLFEIKEHLKLVQFKVVKFLDTRGARKRDVDFMFSFT
jgi:vesicle coat complex subunit